MCTPKSNFTRHINLICNIFSQVSPLKSEPKLQGINVLIVNVFLITTQSLHKLCFKEQKLGGHGSVALLCESQIGTLHHHIKLHSICTVTFLNRRTAYLCNNTKDATWWFTLWLAFNTKVIQSFQRKVVESFHNKNVIDMIQEAYCYFVLQMELSHTLLRYQHGLLDHTY